MSLHELLNDLIALDVNALSPMEAMTALLNFKRRALAETVPPPPAGPTLGEVMRDSFPSLIPPIRRPRPWVHIRSRDGLLHIRRLGDKASLCGVDPFASYDADGDRFLSLAYQDCPTCTELRAQAERTQNDGS